MSKKQVILFSCKFVISNLLLICWLHMKDNTFVFSIIDKSQEIMIDHLLLLIDVDDSGGTGDNQ